AMVVEPVKLGERPTLTEREPVSRAWNLVAHRKRGKTERERPLGVELDLARRSRESQVGMGDVRDAERADAAFGTERRHRRVIRGGMIEDRIDELFLVSPRKEVV